jgi:hypothetical protein
MSFFDSVDGRREEDALQGIELFKRLAGTDSDGEKWVLRNDDRHACLMFKTLTDPMEEGSTACKNNAFIHNVG